MQVRLSVVPWLQGTTSTYESARGRRAGDTAREREREGTHPSAYWRSFSLASCGSVRPWIWSTACWSEHTSHSCRRGEQGVSLRVYWTPYTAHSRRRLQRPRSRRGRSRRTPSHATMRKSSSGRSVVSVVYGEPTTNCFICESPSERVTAR